MNDIIFKHKKILVTGGAGFLGSHVVKRLLECGVSVVILDKCNAETTPSKQKMSNLFLMKNIAAQNHVSSLRSYIGDLLNEDFVRDVIDTERPSACIHAAGLVYDRRSVHYPTEYVMVNIVGTQKLLQALADHDCKMVVTLSTRSVFGQVDDPDIKITEENAKKPINPYGASKLGTEAMAHVYHHLYNMNINIIRIFALYGPRGRLDMIPRQLIEKVHNKITIPKFGDGSATRDWMYVEDAVDAIMLAVQTPLGFQIFNVGTGVRTSLNELINIAEEVVGNQAIIKQLPVPPGDAKFVGVADSSKAAKLLGWKPKTSLLEGPYKACV